MLDLSKYVNQRKTLQTEINTLVKGLEEHFDEVSLDAFDIMELIDADELDDTVSFDISIFKGLGWINAHHQANLVKEFDYYAKRNELPATFESNVSMGAYSTTCDVAVECEIKDFIQVASHFINWYEDEADFNELCGETLMAIYEMSHDSAHGEELTDECAGDEPLEDRLEYFFDSCKDRHGMDTLATIEYMENNDMVDDEYSKGITEAVREIKFKATLAA